MENIKGYYNIMIAMIIQAFDDFLAVNSFAKWHHMKEWEKLDEQSLREFLERMFSDKDKVDMYMKQAIYLRDNGYVAVPKGDIYNDSKRVNIGYSQFSE